MGTKEKKKLKMAFIDLTNFHDWPMGGMLTYELAILPYLADEYDLELWGCSVDNKVPEPLILNGKEYPINIFINTTTNKRLIPNYFKAYFKINQFKDYFEKANYDIVYAHTASCLVPIAKMKRNKKTVVAFHQHGLNYLNSTDMKVKMQKGMNTSAQILSDVVFVVSGNENVKAHAINMQNKSKAKFIPIGSPLDLSLYNFDRINEKIKTYNDSPVFVNTGRVCPWKNQDLLIDAFKLYLDDEKNDAKLYIIGDGSIINQLNEKIKKYNLVKNIFLLGKKTHKETLKYLEEADVFAFPSKGEGMPLSILEAFASGLPVVCFDVEGVGNLVDNGVTGIVLKNQSSQDFAKGMALALKEKQTIAKSCLEISCNFSAKIIAGKIIHEINIISNKT